jgi:hypothetical protein
MRAIAVAEGQCWPELELVLGAPSKVTEASRVKQAVKASHVPVSVVALDDPAPLERLVEVTDGEVIGVIRAADSYGPHHVEGLARLLVGDHGVVAGAVTASFLPQSDVTAITSGAEDVLSLAACLGRRAEIYSLVRRSPGAQDTVFRTEEALPSVMKGPGAQYLRRDSRLPNPNHATSDGSVALKPGPVGGFIPVLAPEGAGSPRSWFDRTFR